MSEWLQFRNDWKDMMYDRDFTVAQLPLCRGTHKKRRGLRGERIKK